MKNKHKIKNKESQRGFFTAKIIPALVILTLTAMLAGGALVKADQADDPTPSPSPTESIDPETSQEVEAEAANEFYQNVNHDEDEEDDTDSIEITDLEAESEDDESAEETFSLLNLADEENDEDLIDSGEIEISAENNETGPDSENTAITEVNNETSVTNNNNAWTYNRSGITANTGNNMTSYNTGSGIIVTQDASGTGQLMNVINKNITQIPEGSGITGGAQNNNTGPGSDNLAQTDITNKLTVKNINNSNTINQVNAKVTSGKNDSSFNTGHGIVLTGDANLSVDLITMANTNLVGNQLFYANAQNVFSDWQGNIDLRTEAAANFSPLSSLLVEASNNCTGPGSNNQAIVNVNDEVTIINHNNGVINNEVNAEVVSGRNKSSKNTGSGSVTTGNVNSAVNVLNFLNSNVTASNWWMKSLNVFGSWDGDILLPAMPTPNLSILEGTTEIETGNSQTGPGSENETEINIENETSIDNQNDAIITNDINLKTETGNNQTSYNGGSGVIKFGDAKAETNVLNVANLNVTGDSWWMVVVNKFGSWQGTTIGSPSTMGVSASQNATVFAPQNSGITVTNNTTGPESNNSAGVNINHSTEIENINDAEIINTLNIADVTGENETQFNTGHGYIDTGDIRATNNLINFANANITVGNWLVTVVNVFGDWRGDLIFSDDLSTNCPGGSACGSGTGGSTTSGNQNTGPGSENNSSSSSNNTNNTTNNNNATTTNDTDIGASSGDNSASYNTGSGVVSTGGANAGSSVGNNVNGNANSSGNGNNGNTNSGNQNTGAGSNNDSSASNDSSTDTTNNNNSNTNNNVNGNNSTGSNNNNYNTGDGIIDTGWAEAYLEVYNENNQNETMSMGDLIDDFDPGNDNGGDNDPGTNDPDPGDNNGGGNNNGGNTGGGGNIPSGGGGGGQAILPVPEIIAQVKKLKGDLNNDGKIDDYDLSILLANWGSKFKNANADANGDGKADDYDLSIVLAGWGSSSIA